MSESYKAIFQALQAGVAQGRLALLEVSSNSMQPLLRQGDEIGVVAARPDQLQIGDVVVFGDNAHFTTHRYWGHQDHRLLSRGDASTVFDPPWLPAALLGRVVMRQRREHKLWLDRGRGQWLNQALFRLLCWEQSAPVQWRSLRPLRLVRRSAARLLAITVDSTSLHQRGNRKKI